MHVITASREHHIECAACDAHHTGGVRTQKFDSLVDAATAWRLLHMDATLDPATCLEPLARRA